MNNMMNSHCYGGTPRDRANSRRVMLWSVAWAGSMLIASAVLLVDESRGFVGIPGQTWGVIAASISTLLGVATLGAYRRLLREADELRQKIELDALAIAVGVGVVGGLGCSMTTRSLGLGEPNLAIVIAAMLISYAIGVVIGHRRFA